MGFLQEVVEKMGLPLEGLGMVGEENRLTMVAGTNLEMGVNLQVEERHEELPVGVKLAGVLVVMVEAMRLVGVLLVEAEVVVGMEEGRPVEGIEEVGQKN